MKKVFNIGGASYNYIIHLDEFPAAAPKTIHQCIFKETVGNTGVGKAVTLSKLSFDTIFHAMIGKDIYGKKIIKYLDQPNLSFMYDLDSNGSERHLNIMNKDGDRISIFMNSISDTPSIDYLRFAPYIKSADFVIINIANYCRNLLALCKSNNKQIWTDLHDYDGKNHYHQDFIDASDYIFLSSDNLKNYRSFMEFMIHKGKKLVVCTHGKKGASALTKEGWVETPILKNINIKDTNGAGDAFFSGFIYGFSKEYSIQKCMQLGTIAGGLCIQSELIASEELSVQFLENEYLKNYGI